MKDNFWFWIIAINAYIFISTVTRVSPDKFMENLRAWWLVFFG